LFSRCCQIGGDSQQIFVVQELKETVTLYGDTLAGGSNYYHNLMLMVTDADGKLITAYTPSLKGGYNLLLSKAPAGKGSKKETVILAAPQGTAGESVAYRVLDFGKSDKVKETFTDVDSLGITTSTAYLSGNRFKVSCDVNGSLRLLEGDVNGSDKLHVFDTDGNVQKQYLRPMVTGLLSLIPSRMESSILPKISWMLMALLF
jgi:hypothetical protein